MIKLFLFFLVMFFLSCSTSNTSEYLRNAKIHTIAVSSKKEARAVIENKIRFLNILFEQSQDPYYGKLKWSEDCLKQNKIGKLEIGDSLMLASSILYLDSDGNPGLCSGKLFNVTLVYCYANNAVKEIKTPLPLPSSEINWSQICD